MGSFPSLRYCIYLLTLQLAGVMLTNVPSCSLSDDKILILSNRKIRQTETQENPQADIDETHACYRFSKPDYENMEFYSPGFSTESTYRNLSDCILVLEAPPGKLIKLDFRDYFEIEDGPGSDCKNDYLEVRDGEYGFSKLIGRAYCGKEFPPELESSDRHLWIHFKSDANIEYRGFRAVFEFIDRHPDPNRTPEILPCRMEEHFKEEGFFGKKNISDEIISFVKQYSMPIDCIWSITVKDKWKIQLQFEKFELNKPNECEKNFIQIFSNTTDLAHEEKKFCGSMADTVLSKSNKMDLDKNSAEKECAPETEYSCEDGTCISSTLVCNGRYNCRFRWDEDECPTAPTSPTDDHIVIIMVIFSLILSGMCLTFIFNCVKKLMRDHHTIQEYIRQSREQQLNELEKTDPGINKSPSRSHSNSSSGSPRFNHAHHSATPCYVPENDRMPILVRSERSISISNEQIFQPDICTVDSEMPEMCDSACQTRESLFTVQGFSSGNSTPSHSGHTNSPPVPFTNFDYQFPNDKFRAEAKIEIDSRCKEQQEQRRLIHVQTRKSAPDVIVTH